MLAYSRAPPGDRRPRLPQFVMGGQLIVPRPSTQESRRSSDPPTIQYLYRESFFDTFSYDLRRTKSLGIFLTR